MLYMLNYYKKNNNKKTNTEHHLELVMTETVTIKQKANKLEQEVEHEKEAANKTKDQLQHLSLN